MQDDFDTAAPFKRTVENGDYTQMWCPDKSGDEYTNYTPWANGTPCGHKKVCQYKKCFHE